MPRGLSESKTTEIRHAIDQITADKDRIPGCVVVVVGQDGIPIFQHASGTRGHGTKEPMTFDTVFWIASCTKIISSIAVMQMVEQGKFALDDADQVEEICPELKTKQILKNVDDYGRPEFVDKKNRITLRMLLAHTAGFSYTLFHDNLLKWAIRYNRDDLGGLSEDILGQPLVLEPGTKWSYGCSHDWAGVMVERVSGLSLDEYLKRHVFQPLAVREMSMLPTAAMKRRLAHTHARTVDGKIRTIIPVYRRPLIPETADEKAQLFQSAGGGLFGKPTEFCQILAALLPASDPSRAHPILPAATIAHLFTNQIPQCPDFARNPVISVRPDMTNSVPELYPQPDDPPQGWSAAGFLSLHEGPTGRGPGTAHWGGMPNVYWWCDRERGVAGMVATQIVPFVDPEVMDLWAMVERMVYAGLAD